MSVLPDQVHGRRLLLRRWIVDDARVLDTAVRANLDHLRPWMPWIATEPLSIDARRQLIESWEHDWAGSGDVVLGAFLDGIVVGGCGLHRRAGPDTLEIGYWIHVDHLGKGYATEIARSLTTTAFEIPDIVRVEIHHDKANTRSQAIPERLGYHIDGESADEIAAPSEIGIDVGWSVTRTSWHP